MSSPEGTSVSTTTATVTAGAQNMQRLMPLLYLQSNMKHTTTNNPTNVAVNSNSNPNTTPGTVQLTVPQIISSGSTPHLIHQSQNQNSQTITYLGTLIKQGSKGKEHQKVILTSLPVQNKANMTGLILPNAGVANTTGKTPMTSLILQSNNAQNKTMTGLILPNAGNNTTGKQPMTSVILPTSNLPIVPNKKVPIPNLVSNLSQKNTSIPNIIRQATGPGKGQMTGIFIPPTTNATSLLIPNNQNLKQKNQIGMIPLVSNSSSTNSNQVGLIMPPNTSTPSQLTNLILTSSSPTATSGNNVMSYIISNSSSTAAPGTSLLVPTSSVSGTTTSTQVNMILPSSSVNGSSSQMTSIMLPVGTAKTGFVQHVTISNGKITHTESKPQQSVRDIKTSSSGTTSLLLPPLQPITAKDSCSSIIQLAKTNGITVPDSLIMTPVNEEDVSLAKKEKETEKEFIDSMEIEMMTVEKVESSPFSNEEKEKMFSPPRIQSPESPNLRCDEIFISGDKDDNVVLDGEVTVRRLAPDITHDVRHSERRNTDDDVNIEIVKPDRDKECDKKIEKPRDKECVKKIEASRDKECEKKIEKPRDKECEKKIEKPRDKECVKKIEKLRDKECDKKMKIEKPEDIDPMEVLEWDQRGVGKLPGSNLQFRLNEFGMMEVLDNWSENKEEMNSSATSAASSRRSSEDKPPSFTDEIQPSKRKSPDEIYCCEGCGCYGLQTEFLMDTRFCSIGCKKIVMARTALAKKRHDDKLRDLRMRRKKRKASNMLVIRAKKDAEMRVQTQKIMDSKKLSQDEQKQAVAELTVKAWVNKMAELRNKKNRSKSFEGINIQKDEVDEITPAVSPSPSFDTSIKSENASQTPAESDGEENVKGSPWLTNSGEFVWNSYLQFCNKAKAAPVRLFKDPFPYGKNGFKIGMKLEGIDPEHQSCFCVLTVAEVKGHRLRLHFDGYPDNHDFWTNSDSTDIFQPGWCEKNNHRLNPPGFIQEPFNWATYLKQCKAQPAPKYLFAKSSGAVLPNQFRVGMKLEAVDRKNSSLICVASVADLIDNRLLIHFDSWGDVYDYWTDPSSPYIHPVGWCKENGHNLTPPSTFKNLSFSWDAYLKETKSVAAPARAFKTRPPSGFKKGMKLEAIDKRAPSFLRIASVKDVNEHQIWITFDGFPDEFGYWVDDDSPDIHPICWGNKTGHPIEPPPNLFPSETPKTDCTTPGCRGDGNIKGAKYSSHQNTSLCPYSSQHLNKEGLLPDRLCAKPEFYEIPEPEPFKTKSKENNDEKQGREKDSKERDLKDKENNLEPRKTRLSLSTLTPPEKEENKYEPIEEKVERRGRKRKIPEPETFQEELNRFRKELVESVFNPGYKPTPADVERWTKHSYNLNQKVQMTGGDPRRWNNKQVAAFINTVVPSHSKSFLDQEIDGESFLMLSQSDLQDFLGFKLGPAIKIFNCISLLREKVL